MSLFTITKTHRTCVILQITFILNKSTYKIYPTNEDPVTHLSLLPPKFEKVDCTSLKRLP